MKDESVEFFHRFNKLKHSVIAQPLVAQLHQKTYYLLPLFKYFFPKTLEVTRKSRIFAASFKITLKVKQYGCSYK